MATGVQMVTRKRQQLKPMKCNRTFNCGVGMVIALPQSQVETALAILKQSGEMHG